MIKYTKSNLEKLESIYTEIGYHVRYEKGNFNAGYCIVDSKKMVIMSKFFDTESRINTLVDILANLNVDNNTLSPKAKQLFKLILRREEEDIQLQTNDQ